MKLELVRNPKEMLNKAIKLTRTLGIFGMKFCVLGWFTVAPLMAGVRALVGIVNKAMQKKSTCSLCQIPSGESYFV